MMRRVVTIATVYAAVAVRGRSLQVTLSIELNDAEVDEFERMIPVQLAQPPWNYTQALSKGITVKHLRGHTYIRQLFSAPRNSCV